jgi:hypothetical protein
MNKMRPEGGSYYYYQYGYGYGAPNGKVPAADKSKEPAPVGTQGDPGH